MPVPNGKKKEVMFAKKFMNKAQVNFLCVSGVSVYTVKYRFSHFNPPNEKKNMFTRLLYKNDSTFAARCLYKIINGLAHKSAMCSTATIYKN